MDRRLDDDSLGDYLVRLVPRRTRLDRPQVYHPRQGDLAVGQCDRVRGPDHNSASRSVASNLGCLV
jgi:hypothetical protein